MLNRFRLAATLAIIANLPGTVPMAQATVTWIGGGSNANINEPTNWSGGTIPLINTSNTNANVVFSGTTTNNVTMVNAFDYNPLWRNVTFDATAGPFVFGRDSTPTGPGVTYDFHFNWSSGASLTINNSTNPQTFNLDNIYFRKGKLNAAAGDFVLNGVLNIGANAVVASVNGINFDGANNIYVNNGFVGNTGCRLDKNGVGTVFLGESPVDTFTNVNNSAVTTTSGRWGGQLSIANGTVQISHDFSLGEPGSMADPTQNWTEIRSPLVGLGTDTAALALTNNITTPEIIYLGGRTVTNAHIVNKSGTNTLSGTLVTETDSTANFVSLQSDGTAPGDKFVVSGEIQQTSLNVSVLGLQGAGNGLVSGTITQPNSLTGNIWNVSKRDGGTWTLSGNNAYTGTTTVEGGTLLVNGTHTGGDTYTVNAGGTLGGSGTISANVLVNVGGNLAPGASVGTLSVGGATIPGTLKVEYNGSAIDLLQVSGTLDITGGAVDFQNLGMTNLSASSHVFATYGTLTGSAFSSITGLPSGFAINYHYLGNQIALVIAIPGDFDGDSDVDGADFVAWQTNFPTASGATRAQGDADADGDVDGADFVVWQTHFPTPASPGTSAVPEPGACLLASIGLGAFMLLRRSPRAAKRA